MPDPTPPTALIDPDRLRHLMKNESRTWGKLVRARRDALGFTLDQVARLSGTTPQTLHKIEKGQIAPGMRCASRSPAPSAPTSTRCSRCPTGLS